MCISCRSLYHNRQSFPPSESGKTTSCCGQTSARRKICNAANAAVATTSDRRPFNPVALRCILRFLRLMPRQVVVSSSLATLVMVEVRPSSRFPDNCSTFRPSRNFPPTARRFPSKVLPCFKDNDCSGASMGRRFVRAFVVSSPFCIVLWSSAQPCQFCVTRRFVS